MCGREFALYFVSELLFLCKFVYVLVQLQATFPSPLTVNEFYSMRILADNCMQCDKSAGERRAGDRSEVNQSLQARMPWKYTNFNSRPTESLGQFCLFLPFLIQESQRKQNCIWIIHFCFHFRTPINFFVPFSRVYQMLRGTFRNGNVVWLSKQLTSTHKRKLTRHFCKHHIYI